eukprot:TRINITY_DN49250_c0_g1_i1.p1 TRINITY_DN49250_c0_g1~~TRINITY_DN49250_c0_g1_i1.p1  ORF type:complete len:636 (+),score=161.34 TRINITY_DN49250_c0_g1_i1:158-2065(+)
MADDDDDASGTTSSEASYTASLPRAELPPPRSRRSGALLAAAAAKAGLLPTFAPHGELRLWEVTCKLLGPVQLPAEVRIVLKLQHRIFDAGWVKGRAPAEVETEKGEGNRSSSAPPLLEYSWPCLPGRGKAPDTKPMFEWLLDGDGPPRDLQIVAQVFGQWPPRSAEDSQPEEAHAKGAEEGCGVGTTTTRSSLLGFFEVPLFGFSESGAAKELSGGPFIRSEETRTAAATSITGAAPPGAAAAGMRAACSLRLRCSWRRRGAFLDASDVARQRTSQLCSLADNALGSAEPALCMLPSHGGLSQLSADGSEGAGGGAGEMTLELAREPREAPRAAGGERHLQEIASLRGVVAEQQEHIETLRGLVTKSHLLLDESLRGMRQAAAPNGHDPVDDGVGDSCQQQARPCGRSSSNSRLAESRRQRRPSAFSSPGALRQWLVEYQTEMGTQRPPAPLKEWQTKGRPPRARAGGRPVAHNSGAVDGSRPAPRAASSPAESHEAAAAVNGYPSTATDGQEASGWALPAAVPIGVVRQRRGSSRQRSSSGMRAAAPGRRTLRDDEVWLHLRQAFRSPMEAFRAFDANGDGLVSLSELKRGLEAVSLPGVLSDGFAERAFKEADSGGLGFLSMGRLGELLGFF